MRDGARLGGPRRFIGVAVALAVTALCATVALAAGGSLTFLEQDKNGVSGVGGIDAPLDVAVSPDGKNVYVAGSGSSAVATFTRDPGTGALTFLEQDVDGVSGVDGIQGAFGLAVSPDGKNVYVAGRFENALATFTRDPGTGALIYVSKLVDGAGGVDGLSAPWGVTVSPDSKNVYVAGSGENAIATFSRDTTSGALTFLAVAKDGVSGVDGLAGITNVAVSPLPGTNLYGASCGADNAVSTFTRDPSTGAISYLEVHRDGVAGVDGLNCTRDVAVSPDGANVYSVAESDDAVATFSRAAANGALTFVESDADGVGGVDGLDGARDVAVSPDCSHVYVGSTVDDAVATLTRDGSSGSLTFLERAKDGVAGVDGIDQAAGVTIAPGGASVYGVGELDDAVATFSRQATGGSCSSTPPPGGPAQRTISLSVSKKKIKKGKKTTLKGDLSAPQDVAGCESGQLLELQKKGPKDGSFKTAAQLSADSSGGFSSKQKLKKTTQFRVMIEATASCGAAESAAVKVKVKKPKKKPKHRALARGAR
jgi:6-phosphogluconolactonase (cycloisomerase 2 family)